MARRVRILLNEPSTSAFLDSQTTYDFLFEAAKAWVVISKCLRKTQSISTVADQAAYTLDGDFIGNYLRDDDRDFFIKYNDGSDDHFLDFKPYQEIIRDNDTDSITVPNYWGITTDPTLDSQIAVDASAAGVATGGKCTLTVATAAFADVTPGDIAHNTDDTSDGVVVKYTSTTSIDVCLFGGTANDITSADSFIIQPRGRLQLVLDPPPSTASHTITVYALQNPAPVYDDYSVYPFAFDYAEALSKYAAWLYKYRDKEPDFGNAWYQFFLAQAQAYGELFKEAVGRDTSRVVPRFR